VADRQEAESRELRLAAVGDADLGRALHVLVAVVGHEHVRRQVFDLAATFGTADRRAPAVFGEGARQVEPIA
jgi:hypothetical protein